MIAVDASEQSHITAKWAAHNVAKEGDVVHLCTVTQPFVYPAAGAGPMGASVIGLRCGAGTGRDNRPNPPHAMSGLCPGLSTTAPYRPAAALHWRSI